MEKHTILIVDDESAQRLILSGHLKQKGFNVLEAASGNDALSIVNEKLIDIIITDFKMPDITGLDLLKKVKATNPEITVVIVTAFGTIETAVKAMKEGAYDYLTKPIDLDELDLVIKKILERQQLLSENRMLKEQLVDKYNLSGFVADSKKMESVLNFAVRAADSKASILIRGESGTGKEVLAKAIHFMSPRSDKPFIAVSCAALNENLLESELFGHEKGAFTGADKQRRGRFELADEGTLFLDEIGDLPISTQIKLLRVLQEEQFERVGGSYTLSVDVRIIAATNRNIEQLISEGKFREDLFYRINVVTIEIPLLKDRKEDILPLIDFFIGKFIKDTSKKKAEFSKEALDVLIRYDYPGNIRELENIIHHSIVLSRNEIISTDDLPLGIKNLKSEERFRKQTNAMTLPEQVETFEKKMIIEALHESNNNQSKAAKRLGISEGNLRYKLEKLGLKKK
ncbi:MAG: sigma-54-dependent Fis family transcriptional regulator [Ignavibacteria bacterium]|nr:sigma-54-dependent Fis family transcriptional regulator [Ignavibacteria bacterium]